MAKTNLTASDTGRSDLQRGAEAFDQLIQGVGKIADENCTRYGYDIDGRDYAAMCSLVEDELRRRLAASEGERHGFVRGLALMLCLNASGAPMEPGEYNPIQVMARSFA